MSIRRVALIVLYACLGLSLAACAPMLRTHGYLPSKAETDALIIGIDTKATVEDAVGRPQDMGMRDGDSWYYVENTMSTYLFFAPEVAERTVLTLDFDPDGVLSAKTTYGLQDGQVVDLVTRITPTDRRRRNLLNQIFGNIGAVTPPLPN